MATKAPIVQVGGELQELTSPDTLSQTSLGIQTVKVPTGNVLTTVLASLTVTWPIPYPDLAYTVQATCETSGLNLIQVQGITSRTTTQVTISLKNLSLATTSGTLHLLGIKDA